MRAAVVALLAFLERATLVLADDEHLLVFQFRETGHDGPVVAEGPVAVQLDELVKDQFDVVERLRTLFVPRQVLDDAPGIEVLERLAALLIDLCGARLRMASFVLGEGFGSASSASSWRSSSRIAFSKGRS